MDFETATALRDKRIDQVKTCFSMQNWDELKFLFTKAWDEAFDLGYDHHEAGGKKPKRK